MLFLDFSYDPIKCHSQFDVQEYKNCVILPVVGSQLLGKFRIWTFLQKASSELLTKNAKNSCQINSVFFFGGVAGEPMLPDGVPTRISARDEVAKIFPPKAGYFYDFSGDILHKKW